MQYYNADDFDPFSFKKQLKNYSFSSLRSDAFAAVSVAMLTIPQAMAYALLAGLPLSCGLMASIYAAFFASFVGSSRYLVVGSANSIAILLQSLIAEVMFTYYRDVAGPEKDIIAMQILTQTCLFVGVFQLAAGFLKLGRLTQFVSHSVIVAYITGTAVAIVVNQLYAVFGILLPGGLSSTFDRAVYLFSHIDLLHIPTLGIGAISLTLIVLLKKIDKRIPAPLLTFIFMALIVHFFDGAKEIRLVGDAGSIQDVIPTVSLPYFDTQLMNALLPTSFAIALLSVMDTTSVAKSIAANTGQRIYINQEILGVGFGNIVSSLIGALPVAGSPSRSSLLYTSGAKTRLAVIFNCVFVGGALYALASIISLIPFAALSTLLLVTALNIVSKKQFLLCLKATNADAFVLITTLLSCLFFSFDVAFYIGVILSITSYLKKAAIPQLVEYNIKENGELEVLDTVVLHEHRVIRCIKVEGELFFGAADLFQATLKTIAEDDTSTKVIILQLKNARDIDATVCLAIHQVYEYLKSSNRHLILCGITDHIWQVLSDSGIVEMVGKANLFVFEEKHPHLYLIKANKRAVMLASSSEKLGGESEEVVTISSEQPSERPLERPEELVVLQN